MLNVVDLPESYFEDDPEPTPVEALCTLPEGGVVGVPLPCVDGEGPDRKKLIAEQQTDATLRNVVELAQKKEKGYSFD